MPGSTSTTSTTSNISTSFFASHGGQTLFKACTMVGVCGYSHDRPKDSRYKQGCLNTEIGGHILVAANKPMTGVVVDLARICPCLLRHGNVCGSPHGVCSSVPNADQVCFTQVDTILRAQGCTRKAAPTNPTPPKKNSKAVRDKGQARCIDKKGR